PPPVVVNNNAMSLPLNPPQAPDPTVAVNWIVANFISFLDDGWLLNESKTLYIRYIRHQGHFETIQMCDALSHRTIVECVLKIFNDHSVCVERNEETPWGVIDEVLHIPHVDSLGHFLLMPSGGDPPVDVAVAAVALEGGGGVGAALAAVLPVLGPLVALGLADA
ncbi:hypothetical protein A2U01_0048115, partial [Trifolium medium]|nr:hypothetical protein [Trifolium medium]